jgi:hypothetical protein
VKVLNDCYKYQSVNDVRETIAVCSEIHTKHTNALRGQNVEFLNVMPGGTNSDHCVLCD